MSRSPLPFMRFYTDDYMADTAHLTTLEHGAYILILINYWRRQQAPKADRLARISGLTKQEWSEVEPVLSELFSVEKDVWFHKRVEHELQRIKDETKRNSKAGKASGKARRNKAPTNTRSTPVQHSFEHSLNGRSDFVEPYIRSNEFATLTVTSTDATASEESETSENKSGNNSNVPEYVPGDETREIDEQFLAEIQREENS